MNTSREYRVGDFFTLNSKLYGLVTYITVAKVNLLHPADKVAFWADYKHPKKTFSACSMRASADCYINPDGCSSQFAYFLSLPLDIANQNWWDKNPHCEYRQEVQRKPRHKTPPSHVALKEYEKWQRQSLAALEVYLTADEVKAIAAKLNDLPISELQKLCTNPGSKVA
jgi:hypothetical protein